LPWCKKWSKNIKANTNGFARLAGQRTAAVIVLWAFFTIGGVVWVYQGGSWWLKVWEMRVLMVWDTAGAVFSALSYLDAFGAGAENKALNPSEYWTRNKEWWIMKVEERGENVLCSTINAQRSMLNVQGGYGQ
jgi:hypothetical protein